MARKSFKFYINNFGSTIIINKFVLRLEGVAGRLHEEFFKLHHQSLF